MDAALAPAPTDVIFDDKSSRPSIPATSSEGIPVATSPGKAADFEDSGSGNDIAAEESPATPADQPPPDDLKLHSQIALYNSLATAGAKPRSPDSLKATSSDEVVASAKAGDMPFPDSEVLALETPLLTDSLESLIPSDFSLRDNLGEGIFSIAPPSSSSYSSWPTTNSLASVSTVPSLASVSATPSLASVSTVPSIASVSAASSKMASLITSEALMSSWKGSSPVSITNDHDPKFDAAALPTSLSLPKLEDHGGDVKREFQNFSIMQKKLLPLSDVTKFQESSRGKNILDFPTDAAPVPSLCVNIETPFEDPGESFHQRLQQRLQDRQDQRQRDYQEDSLDLPSACFRSLTSTDDVSTSYSGRYSLERNETFLSYSPLKHDQNNNDKPTSHQSEPAIGDADVDTLIITPEFFSGNNNSRSDSATASSSSVEAAAAVDPSWSRSPVVTPLLDTTWSASSASNVSAVPTPDDRNEANSGLSFASIATMKSKDIMTKIAAAQRPTSRPPLLPTPPLAPSLPPPAAWVPTWKKQSAKQSSSRESSEGRKSGAVVKGSTLVVPTKSTSMNDAIHRYDDEDVDDQARFQDGVTSFDDADEANDEWETVSKKKRRSDDPAIDPSSILDDDDKIIDAARQLIPTLPVFDAARILEVIKWNNGGSLNGYTLAAILKIYKERCYKTAICHYYDKTGECSYGGACTFAHGKAELRGPGRPSSVTLAAAAAAATNQKKSRSRESSESRKSGVIGKGSNTANPSKSTSMNDVNRHYNGDDVSDPRLFHNGATSVDDAGKVNDEWETVSKKKRRSSQDDPASASSSILNNDDKIIEAARQRLPTLSVFDGGRILEGIKRKNGGNLHGYTLAAIMKLFKEHACDIAVLVHLLVHLSGDLSAPKSI